MGPWHAIGDGERVGTDPCAEFPIYTRGNAGEVYPEVYRPLSFSIAAQAGEQAMRNAMLASGLIRPSEIDGIPITTAVAGGVFGGYFDGRIPPLDEWALRDTPAEPVVAGEVIAGLAGCAGVARGRARIVTDPSDPRGLEPGDVLVAPLTDPSWTPLFVSAEAVVVDVGAVMSHAIIVSRELGIPCAVSARDATRRIPDGALVEVDGGAGTVTILELP